FASQGRKRLQISDARGHGAVPTADLRVRWLDHEVLVGCVRPASMSETVMTGREADGRIGEDVPGIRARETREEDRIDPAAPEDREHRLDDRPSCGGGR